MECYECTVSKHEKVFTCLKYKISIGSKICELTEKLSYQYLQRGYTILDDRDFLLNLFNQAEEIDSRETQLLASVCDEYVEKVKRLVCFLGIKTHTALSCLVETGDFRRFAKGNIYSAYLGLVPGEDSSSDNINRLSIPKAGNSHLRKLLIEASKGICKGAIGHKSKDLKARQSGNVPEVIAYADKANERLRRKYYKMIRHGKKKNVAVTATARELACFIWGMMTDNIAVV